MPAGSEHFSGSIINIQKVWEEWAEFVKILKVFQALNNLLFVNFLVTYEDFGDRKANQRIYCATYASQNQRKS